MTASMRQPGVASQPRSPGDTQTPPGSWPGHTDRRHPHAVQHLPATRIKALAPDVEIGEG
ncbi:hypothetical protein SAMN05216190_103191 [Pseudomonas borbori]|uniref:Uncharacterized protein n=1 Tax=Pseudomonas borbori TaxID=289003 RepID=A0A1I5LR57_9PSED|nr:hypothetical protein SAMN05216190_103191 [Pseudomonas borbori]